MLKAMIVGAGAISDSHIEGYRALADRVRIVAVVDTDLSRAQKKISQFGLEAEAFTDYRAALDRAGIGLVSVCTPPSAHAPVTIGCLEAGAHVIVEKPMAPSLRECDAMIAAAERGGRLLSPVAQMRFKEAPWKIKRLLELGLAGRLHHVQTNAFYWRGGSYYDLDWRGRWETEGGGCTLNHAVHYIDLMLWWAGRPQEVCAFMTNRCHENSEVEDLSTAILRYPDGMLGQVTSSLLHHGERQAILLQADRAAIALPFAVSCCRSLENGFPQPDPDLERTIAAAYEGLPSPRCTGHTGQIENVLQAAEGKGPLLISGADGRGTLELITAIYKSATLHATVNLPLSPDDEFSTSEGIVKAAPRFFRKTRSVSGFSSNTITVGSADIR